MLITELLWGKKKLPGESKPVKTVLSYHDEFLKENSSDKKIKRKSKKGTSHVFNAYNFLIHELCFIFKLLNLNMYESIP